MGLVKFPWKCLMGVAVAMSASMPLQAIQPPALQRRLPAATEQKVDFVRDIQPLFRKN